MSRPKLELGPTRVWARANKLNVMRPSYGSADVHIPATSTRTEGLGLWIQRTDFGREWCAGDRATHSGQGEGGEGSQARVSETRMAYAFQDAAMQTAFACLLFLACKIYLGAPLPASFRCCFFPALLGLLIQQCMYITGTGQ